MAASVLPPSRSAGRSSDQLAATWSSVAGSGLQGAAVGGQRLVLAIAEGGLLDERGSGDLVRRLVEERPQRRIVEDLRRQV